VHPAKASQAVHKLQLIDMQEEEEDVGSEDPIVEGGSLVRVERMREARPYHPLSVCSRSVCCVDQFTEPQS
jgi:hypothetical protein